MKFNVLFILFFFITFSIAEAQLRDDLRSSNDYTGAVTHTQGSSNDLMDMLNMTMSHSYSMTFSNFGGQTHNINAYTNSMLFDLSDNLDAQVDVSVLHSPFGNSFMTNNDLGARVIIDRAKLDYRLSENAKISLEFSQRPYYSPFGMNSHFDRRNSWY